MKTSKLHKVGLSVFNVKVQKPIKASLQDGSTQSSTTVTKIGLKLITAFTPHSTLQFKHITKISQACFFHIRDLRRIHPYLTHETAATIGAALVQSKLDYCNSLFLNFHANKHGNEHEEQTRGTNTVTNTGTNTRNSYRE